MRQHKHVLDTWQRNYHEHIIRNEDDLNSIRQYIMENPRLWAEDSLNPVNAGVKKVTRR
jgi:REP element-mobilizing transposase RayT